MSNRDELLGIAGGNHLYAFRKCTLDGRVVELQLLLSESDDFNDSGQQTTALTELKAIEATGSCTTTWLESGTGRFKASWDSVNNLRRFEYYDGTSGGEYADEGSSNTVWSFSPEYPIVGLKGSYDNDFINELFFW